LTGTIKLMTVNYYDDYAFLNMTMTANKDSLIFLGKGYDAQFTSTRGNLTGTRVYQLDDPAKFTVSAIYYDHRGRIVQQHSSNHLGGYDNEYFTFTFSGKVKQRMLVHSATSSTTRVETYYYNYGNPTTNPTERLLDLKHRLSPNTAQITMAVYTYDEIGRLKTKGLATETSTYSYNVRSWLTRIEGSKFNQTLAYNAPVNGVTPSKALYNGNISAMKWKSGSETVERGYKFTYDGLDRLTAATYGEGANITSNLNNYNEAMTYNDKMGNIRTLVRRGRLDSGYGEIDNLTYTYTGNRLTKVTDAVTTPITYQGVFHFVDGTNAPEEYTYDTNGNITKDLNRNITSITYNELNLPKVITMSGNKSVTYGYDAAGRKLSVVYKSGTTTTTSRDYVGNKVYNNGTLGIVLTEEGYATVSGTPAYYYHLKDHQGNNRVVISQSGAVQEVNHYYPFGGLFGEGVQPSIQRYKYNGKELDREFGLDMYDYGARHYDAALGRWFTVDPLAEKYYSISPYVYVTNNPIRFIDPDGRDVWEINDVGKIVNRIKDKMQDAFYMVDNKGNRTYTTDADGNKSYNSISFEHGTITDSQKAGGLFFKKDATSFSVGNEASGASLFKFFADNTKIEFGLINTQSNGSTVMTNHKEGSVKASLTAQQLSDKWQTVTSIIHNHPNSTQPSGFRAGDTSGDKFAANILPNVDRYVYQPKNNALVMYDNKSIIGTMSWNMVFSPATIVAPRLRTPHTFYPGVGLPPP
ncbi:RHS repeat-associated core domain-containing protein, partial [Proteiniphilum sp.]|uniref:RHS repeat-associated core domain-containing protein n=1 Tax=Proteiniphilum sp. TaxID=1926877 RepID=UPI002B1EFD88